MPTGRIDAEVRRARHGLKRGLPVVAAALLSIWPAAVLAGPAWVLIYYRQIGNQINANNRTIENHLFREDGTKAANIGVTNLANSGTAIFGYSDLNGWNRINPLDPNNCAYDIRIYDPSTPTQNTPNFNFQNLYDGWPDFYSYVTHWMRVSDEARIVTYPQAPVYHYDLVNGLNQTSGFNSGCNPINWVEAPGANSDYRELPSGGWATYQAQTFVVPAGVNRIVSAQAWLARGAADGPFYYWASIHQGGPTGPQVGPRIMSPQHHSVNFKEEALCWSINDVPVTAGQTYALKLEPIDGNGCNVWRTVNNNYPNGALYNGAAEVPEHDMIAVIVGIYYDTTPPHISRSPASFTRAVVRRNNLPNDTFAVSNSGAGVLSYTIAVTRGAEWLSVAPAAGTSTGEIDTITISYSTAGLSVGPHDGTITISAPGADNTPQVVTVNLSVTPPPFAPCDFDTDGDVDQADFGVFQGCLSGSGLQQADPVCSGARLDLDEDVDMDDFGKFLNCLNGSNVPVVTTCAD